MEGFGGSVAGGGRYDKMIGKFTGMETPACGFSIGFETYRYHPFRQWIYSSRAEMKKAFLFERESILSFASIMKEPMKQWKRGKNGVLWFW